MPLAMKDIAEAAGVTESTVSRALANSPRVKLETRRRIQHLAREMGYVPSAIARGLATKRTSTLGVVVMDIADPFIAEVVSALDGKARDCGYSLILSSCGTDPQREMSAIKLLLQQRVDAVIVPDPLVADSTLPQLEGIGVPVILMNRKHYAYSVRTDNLNAARLAVDHLLELGHRRIAYIGGSRRPEESLERQAGYRAALMARGILVDPALSWGWGLAGRMGGGGVWNGSWGCRIPLLQSSASTT
jgi:DNA-binding LacI/PurR family transcriptional regulator